MEFSTKQNKDNSLKIEKKTKNEDLAVPTVKHFGIQMENLSVVLPLEQDNLDYIRTKVTGTENKKKDQFSLAQINVGIQNKDVPTVNPLQKGEYKSLRIEYDSPVRLDLKTENNQKNIDKNIGLSHFYEVVSNVGGLSVSPFHERENNDYLRSVVKRKKKKKMDINLHENLKSSIRTEKKKKKMKDKIEKTEKSDSHRSDENIDKAEPTLTTSQLIPSNLTETDIISPSNFNITKKQLHSINNLSSGKKKYQATKVITSGSLVSSDDTKVFTPQELKQSSPPMACNVSKPLSSPITENIKFPSPSYSELNKLSPLHIYIPSPTPSVLEWNSNTDNCFSE